MNPVNRFKIENYNEILQEIEERGRIEYLRDLENRVIQEIVHLVKQGTDEAKADLQRLEAALDEDLSFKPRNHLLISALKRSLKGALDAARICLF
ncbi:MAG: hypothetical protein QME05_00855 [Candidatus Margulisbacteria bacterium]|nr:hypothetical protein [Candidatus Margulisiibacteriota bacterium]